MPKKDKYLTCAVAFLLLLCAAHFLFSAYWIHFKSGMFYYQRDDDMARIAQALRWSRRAWFRPDGEWLPFPTYLLGICLRFLPNPYSVPLYCGSLLSAASLVLVGLISLELIPDKPMMCLLAPALTASMGCFLAAGCFERIGISAGSEPFLWFFLLLGAYFWLMYRRLGSGFYLFASAAAFFLDSGTRYESWLFIGLLLPFAIWFFHAKREKYWRRLAFVVISVAYILIFIGGSEMHMPKLPMGGASGMPLSWDGIRLDFHGPPIGILRSFGYPVHLWFDMSPLLALLECAGAVSVLLRRPSWRWYPAWAALYFLSLAAVSGIFGFSMDYPARVLISLHLLLIPLACDFLGWLTPKAVPFLPAAAAAAIFIFSWDFDMPRIKDAGIIANSGQKETFVAAKAIHETEDELKIKPRLLFELQGGAGKNIYSFAPLQFAVWDRLILDRKVLLNDDGSLDEENNPSVFGRPPARLARYLAAHDIGWIVAHSAKASASLRGLAVPVAEVGSTDIFERGLSKIALARCRRRVRKLLPALSQ